ncbi:hypothetical protein EcoAe3A3_29610 [Escherichia coli]|nr:hypothetical protein EcoAe3A3_29610 [Escherichia coli]
MAVMADRRSQRTFIQAKAAEQTTGRSQSLSVTLKNGNKAHIIAIKTVFAVDAGAGVRDQFVMDYLNNAIVDSIGQRNSYVKTWGCGGFLNETNIYSRGKSLCF